MYGHLCNGFSISIQHQPKECLDCGSMCKLLSIPSLLSTVESSIIACPIVSKSFQLLENGGQITDHLTLIVFFVSYKKQVHREREDCPNNTWIPNLSSAVTCTIVDFFIHPSIYPSLTQPSIILRGRQEGWTVRGVLFVSFGTAAQTAVGI